MTGITILQFSPVTACFCCGWVKSPICFLFLIWYFEMSACVQVCIRAANDLFFLISKFSPDQIVLWSAELFRQKEVAKKKVKSNLRGLRLILAEKSSLVYDIWWIYIPFNVVSPWKTSIDVQKNFFFMNVEKIHRKLLITESQFYFANISATEAQIFMKFFMVVNQYLIDLRYELWLRRYWQNEIDFLSPIIFYVFLQHSSKRFFFGCLLIFFMGSQQ